MVESMNKLIKYNYLYPSQIPNQKQLTDFMRTFEIPDYNNKRPHGSLGGLTPLEAYQGKQLDFKKLKEKMKVASCKRIQNNQNHSCDSCSVDRN